MAKPLHSKEIVTVQELAISNILEIEALLFENGIITEEEFIDGFKRLGRRIKEKARK